MRDFYPEDMRLRNRIFDSWRAAAVASGFQPYDACVVESLDLLQRKAGEEIVNQIYSFEDKSGRHLALRPEMTPTLARMIAARQGALAFPVKWFTVAQCFRYERMTRGRKREHYQLNLDIVAEDAVTAEAEVLFTAIEALRRMGVPDAVYKIRLSNRALLSELLASLGIPPSAHNGVFIALDKKGKIPEDEIEAIMQAEGLDATACKSAFDLMNINSLDDAAAIAGPDSPAIARVRELLSLLDEYGVRNQIVFDISVIRGLSYYTGIVFEAFDTAGEFRAIFGGGRYDNLLSTIGGKPASAVGLGFGDVVIGEIIASLNLPDPATFDCVAVGYMTADERAAATRLTARLRSEGRAVSLQLRPVKAKAFFTFAAQQATEAIFIGPDDRMAGFAKCKNLASREQTDLPL